ncbi:MAG: response regulator [Myxococcales bacterium]|nr:response regulator [Myxococcales bacterium]
MTNDHVPSSEQPTMLIVDDDRPFREALAAAFTRRGYEVRAVANADDALALCAEWVPERAVLDVRMPGLSGLELLRALKRIDPNTEIVLLTGYGSIPSAVEAVRAGATNYLTKPAEPDEIEAAFRSDLREAREVRDARETRTDAVSGETPSLDRANWEHIQRVLADCGGNISEAARRLGLHRRTLQRKLQKMPAKR